MASQASNQVILQVGIDTTNAKRGADEYSRIVADITRQNQRLLSQGKQTFPIPPPGVMPATNISYPLVGKGTTNEGFAKRTKYSWISEGQKYTTQYDEDILKKGFVARQDTLGRMRYYNDSTIKPGNFQVPKSKAVIEGLVPGSMKQSIAPIKEATKATQNFTSVIGQHVTRAAMVVPIWMAIRTVMEAVSTVINDSLTQWKNYEYALKEIRVVGIKVSETAEATVEQIDNLGKTVMSFASIYGVSATKALEAAKLFAQQGLDIQEVTEATRASIIGSQVLGQNIETVAENLTSAIRAYNLEFSDSLSIIDKWMAVQKQYAVTAKDLADGMKTAGATASAFGISVDKLNGDLTAIIEVTRRSGSQAANALQMIYTRIFNEGAKAIQNIGGVATMIDEQGKATLEQTGINREAAAVLDDLAAKWHTYNETEKINIAIKVGSRRQAAPFLALMDNYNRSLEAQVTSLMAAGEALKSFNILQDSVQVKLQQLDGTYKQLLQSLGNTTVWKSLIDWTNQLFISLVGLVNVMDMLRIKTLQTNQAELDRLSITQSELQNYRELLVLMERMVKLPSSPENDKNKTTIQKGIDAYRKKYPGVNLGNVDAMLEQGLVDSARIQARNIASEAYNSLQIVRKYASKGAMSKALSSYISTNPFYPFIGREQAQEEQLINSLISKYSNPNKNQKEALQEVQLQLEKIVSETESDTISKALANSATGKLKGLLGDEGEKRVDTSEAGVKRYIKSLDDEAEIMKNLGASEEEILRYKLLQWETNERIKGSTEATAAKEELRLDIQKQITSEIKSQADILQTAVSGGMTELLTGEKALSQYLTDVGTTMRKQVVSQFSEGITERLFDVTGLGNVFGAQMVNIKNLFSGKGSFIGGIENAHATVYNWIVKGHRDGMNTAHVVGAGTPASQIAGFAGAGGALGGILGAPAFTYGSNGTILEQHTGGGYRTTVSIPGKRGAFSWGQVAGVGVQSALTGYSAYQSARMSGYDNTQAGLMGVAGGMGSLALTGAMGAFGLAGAAGATGTAAGALGLAGAANFWNPVGWGLLAAGIGLTVASFLGFGGKKSQTQTQTTVEEKTTENRVSSKIDITNKQLELVNRNLVALKATMETYVLPNSAYYGEKRNLEDQFSLHARRGLNQ